ncbi:hypothetical protein KQX54_002213 [Cotesia glomerata]|uniref:Uncharacterized protein n=1 Tax=Cotesia glomerata TaxID=32391 RepID=A0AAV7IIB1_COTGL|nr:hypothetical protein KQX54_002213 [Cotesia glomerata]
MHLDKTDVALSELRQPECMITHRLASLRLHPVSRTILRPEDLDANRVTGDFSAVIRSQSPSMLIKGLDSSTQWKIIRELTGPVSQSNAACLHTRAVVTSLRGHFDSAVLTKDLSEVSDAISGDPTLDWRTMDPALAIIAAGGRLRLK